MDAVYVQGAGQEEESTHTHDHGEEFGKKKLIVLVTAIVLYLAGIAGSHMGAPEGVFLTLFFAAYVLSSYDIYGAISDNIMRGNLLDENFLMAVATIGAAAIGEYPEAVGVMIFYKIGEYFESKAVNKSRKNIEALMNIKPETANLMVDGKIVEVSPEDVKVGDRILVKVGEKVPLDGRVVKGESRFDTSAITGESVLRTIGENDEIVSGIINKTAAVEIEVDKLFEDSTVAKILDMVENSTSKKAKTENFITVFARYYTPIVVGLAVAVALIPPLVFKQPFNTWLYRGLIFLVVSCPCALVLSVPLSYFSGIGVSSKNGILIKGSNYLEALKNVDTVLMDKTGTITKGIFEVSRISLNDGVDENMLLNSAAIAESRSSHPIAGSVMKYCKGKTEFDPDRIDSYEEVEAHGIKVGYDGEVILAGNSRMMEANKIDFEEVGGATTKVYVARNGKYLGCIEISDEIKDKMAETVKKMKSIGIKNIIMLTGDTEKVAKEVADKIGIDKYYAELLPNDKVGIIEKVMNSKGEKSKVAFIGDGINDAPVIARADVGISMGGVGSDAAIEASDVVFMTDEVSKIVPAIKIASATSSIVWQNIIFAIGVKILVLVLSVLDMTNMWAAIFADVGVAVLAVLNSLRILKYRAK